MAASGVDGATALLQQLKTGADAADDKDANPERRRKAAFKAYEVGSICLIAMPTGTSVRRPTRAHTHTRTHAHTHAHATTYRNERSRVCEKSSQA